MWRGNSGSVAFFFVFFFGWWRGMMTACRDLVEHVEHATPMVGLKCVGPGSVLPWAVLGLVHTLSSTTFGDDATLYVMSLITVKRNLLCKVKLTFETANRHHVRPLLCKLSTVHCCGFFVFYFHMLYSISRGFTFTVVHAHIRDAQL